MPTTHCPHCALPLLPAEASGPACPACHAPLTADIPMQTSARAQGPPPVRDRFAPGLLLGALMGSIAAGVVAWLAWPAPPQAPAPVAAAPTPRPPEDGGAVRRALVAAAQANASRGAAERALREAQGQAHQAQGHALSLREQLNQAIARAEAAEKQGRALAKALDEEKNRPRPSGGTTLAKPGPATLPLGGKQSKQLDLPDGDYTVGAMDGELALTLTGKVRRLTVKSVNGHAVLDASKLVAKEVVFTGTINGHARVKLHAPDGRVTLKDINGQAAVDVKAPGGKVTVEEVNGETVVAVLTREVYFANGINGSPELTVTLTREGRLGFRALLGSSRLYWRKEKPLDPDPRIGRGRIAPDAELKRIAEPR